MNDKTRVELGGVQETAVMPLWGRAVETRRPHPLLVDRAAADLLARLDYDFSTLAARLHEITRLVWIARARHCDRTIAAFLQSHPRATIVNLGCGLDTTFERVDNGTLTWLDLDLPDVIALRRRLIPDTPRRTARAASLLDEDWLADLAPPDGLLFVAAGVLYYLDEADVRRLLSRLAQRFPDAELFGDIVSPHGLWVANRIVIARGGMSAAAVLRWGVARPTTIETWDARLRLIGQRPLFRELRRSLPLDGRIVAWGADRLRIISVVHLRLG